MTYDVTYSTTENVFGAEPEVVLRKYSHRIDKSRPILDIGSGQGRNALFLAREGFRVDAIDPSKIAVETVTALAAKEALPIKAYHSDFTTFMSPEDVYSGILIFGLIQILTWRSIELLRDKIDQWTTGGSLVFITGFTTGELSFIRYSRVWKSIGKNSFLDGQGTVRTYLEAGELPQLFDGYGILHYWEGIGPEHRHGFGSIERHSLAEVVLRK